MTVIQVSVNFYSEENPTHKQDLGLSQQKKRVTFPCRKSRTKIVRETKPGLLNALREEQQELSELTQT
jgi:hypothetical protein